MSALYRDTTARRVTVDQNIREILLPDLEAPPNSYRQVQLVVPQEPVVYLSTESEADVRAGLNRTYKLPAMRDSTTIRFALNPGQRLYAAAKIGLAECTLIVEFWQG